MRLTTSVSRRLLVFALLAGPSALAAQGTAADYARADGLRDRFKGLLLDAVDQAAWIDSTPRFWYRKTTKDGYAFVVVDAETREKRPAFDHARLAAALTPVAHRPLKGDALPFNAIRFADHERALLVTVDTTRMRCTLDDYRCVVAAPTEEEDDDPRGVGGGLYGARPVGDQSPRRSPDGKWEALVRNFNVYVRPAGDDAKGTFLSTDGTEDDAYALNTFAWSPDSKRLAAYRVRPGYQREVHYVQSSPEDQLQPKHSLRLYSKPGDVLDRGVPVIFDVAAKRETVVDDALFPNAYNVTALEWRRDGRALTFEYNQRGHQLYRVIEVDAATGRARAVIDERSPTFFEYSEKK